MSGFVFQTTPKVISEIGGISRVGDLIAGLGVHKALVICDPGIAASGLAERATAALSHAGIAPFVFDAVEADPPVRVVRRAAGGAGAGVPRAQTRARAGAAATIRPTRACTQVEIRKLTHFS